MTDHAVTTSSLANDMLAMANKVDRACDDAITDHDTWAALHHLLESLEAARRAACRCRDGRGSALDEQGSRR